MLARHSFSPVMIAIYDVLLCSSDRTRPKFLHDYLLPRGNLYRVDYCSPRSSDASVEISLCEGVTYEVRITSLFLRLFVIRK